MSLTKYNFTDEIQIRQPVSEFLEPFLYGPGESSLLRTQVAVEVHGELAFQKLHNELGVAQRRPVVLDPRLFVCRTHFIRAHSLYSETYVLNRVGPIMCSEEVFLFIFVMLPSHIPRDLTAT